MSRQRRCLIAACGLLAACATAVGPETRRSGFDDLSPALRALQVDDTRNPGLLGVREGEALWSQRSANGRRCADCHTDGLPGVAARHPAFDAKLGRPLTLAGRIDRCRVEHLGQAAQGADGDAVLALAAWLGFRSRGQPIAPPRDERLAPWVERGSRLWQQRLGQLNLSCAQCHDQRAGARLAGALIPQAHPTGYPVYRLEWQGLGSLERRLRGCVAGVRAEPFAPGADEWIALEAFLMRRASGMLHEGVAVRP